MKLVSKLILASLIVSAFTFEGCKKGEGDPFLSLRSRKARVAGEWKVVKGEGTHRITSNNVTYNTTSTYDGTMETNVMTPGNVTTTDKYTVEYTFEKDGTFTMIYTDNNGNSSDVSTQKGNWNFTGGVGETKNKSQLMLTYTSVSDSNGSMTYSGTDAPTYIYNIYQLKSKEMILESSFTTSDDNESSTDKWTLEAK
jgi:hypothetical protein